jgi:predicted site-specific integrase-resolvase
LTIFGDVYFLALIYLSYCTTFTWNTLYIRSIKLSKLFKPTANKAMVIYAYLRVSSDKQDLHNQRHGILEYANTHALSPIQFIENTVSGREKWFRGRQAPLNKELLGLR